MIVLQPRARADLSDAFIERLDQKFQLLAEQCELGRRREELAGGLRSFPVGRYVIFYLAIPAGTQIVRVLHGARHIEDVFTEPQSKE